MGSISERLREEREKLGLTQAQLSDSIKHSRKTQVRYENGERSPDGHYFAALSELGADITYILTGTPCSPPRYTGASKAA